MSAPPLPVAFGNYALGDFVELVAPAAISWWPQTPGWAVVGAVVLALGLRFSWRRLQHWWRNRYRAEALAELNGLPHSADLIARSNGLLKRVSLVAYPRTQVASLSGQQWVEYLNSCVPSPLFDGGCAELLAQGSYRQLDADAAALAELQQACARWIAAHEPPANA